MSLLISLALWFLYSAAAAAGDGPEDASGAYNPCLNCTVCEYPCYPQPAPPPPPPPPSPPPPQQGVGPENCPPPPNVGSGSGSGSAQCCQYSPPGVNYTPVPYDNYSGAQPRIWSSIWSAAAAVLLLQRLLFPYV